jgi:endonuclease/exonuclease/phosphatase family metal-dependent hydrolase
MRLQRDFLRSLEASVIGLFLIQSIRYLYHTLYAHVSSADLVRRVADQERLADLPGYVEPGEVQAELFAVGIALLAPLLALVVWRIRWSIPLAVAVVVVGRVLALLESDSAALAAALVVGAGMLYMALVIMRRPRQFPPMLLLGTTLDVLIRASWDSADPTWDADYTFSLLGQDWTMEGFLLPVAVLTLLLSGVVIFRELEVMRLGGEEAERPGMLSGWGSLALGSYFFIELTLLGLGNAVARWADVDYAIVVPLLLVATVAPLIPKIREQARQLLASFDSFWRGFLWALLLGFWLVIANRFDGIPAVIVLLAAQFMVGLTLWWMIRPRTEEMGGANPTPVLMLVAIVIFGILSIGDYFTYDYAFVRDIEAPFGFLETVLRAMRGLGLYLFLFAALLLVMPMILERRGIPWHDGRQVETLFGLALSAAVAFAGLGWADREPVVRPANESCLRVATLNLHSGYTMLFGRNLELALESLSPDKNAADIVLLQEVDTGRMSSGGVDQVAWLARQLNMHMAFYSLNEELQGLAVLSRLPIHSIEGRDLTSDGPQAGVIKVELEAPDGLLTIYNVWLGYRQTDESGLPLPEERQDQTIQTNELYGYVLREHLPPDLDTRIILGGTFNYDMSSSLYRFWLEQEYPDFEDHFLGLGIEDLQTLFLVDDTSARFDYILASSSLTPTGVLVDQDLVVSDHRVAVLGLNLNPAEQFCNESLR